jgi:hypothetical protein
MSPTPAAHVRSPWLLLAATLADCAASTEPRVERGATDVIVVAPEHEAEREVVRAQELAIRTWIERHQDRVDMCYAGELLAGKVKELSDYEFQVRLLSGSRRAAVTTLSATRPEQEMLEHCIRAALAAIDFLPNNGVSVELRIPIRSPTSL